MRRWTQRAVPWIGGLFIAVIVALAGYDIVESYHSTVSRAGRELDTQARVIAEQTARSVQAIDVVLRHVAQQFRQGTLPGFDSPRLREYLQEQAVGLTQIDGLILIDARGTVRVTSYASPAVDSTLNVSGQEPFRSLQAERKAGLLIDSAVRSTVDGRWMFRIARRLESGSGEFGGAVGARGRIDYYERFYRNVQLDEGTNIALMHQNGTLLARHPPADASLGTRFPLFDQLLASLNAGEPGPSRTASPIDGVERFGSLKLVADYPLAVIVSRDVAAVLAPWRAQSLGTALRTFALSALAALLLFIVMRQLSRLHRARESLEVSQERYALAVAGSDDGIWDFDFVNRRVFGSARGRQLSGLPPGPETQPMDEWFANLPIHPEDAPRRTAAMEAHLAGKTPAYEGEFRMRQPDGSYRWVRIHGLCLRDAQGKPYRMAGSISDIDAHKRAQQALRDSEERFALAVSGSNDGIIDWDVVNDRMYSSERAMEIMGVDSKVTVRSRAEWRDLVKYHPEDLERMKADLADFLEGRSEMRDGEYRIVLPSGEYRWIRHRNKCVRDASGRPIRVAGSVSDVDAGKRAEQALRASEEQYRAIFNGSADALILRDAQSRIVDINPAFLELNGLTRDEALSDRARIFATPESWPMVREMYRRVLSGETVHYELQYERKNGERVDLEIRMMPVRYRGEAHSLSMARDITAQKRAEEALRSSEEQYKAVFNGAADALVVRDADARVVDVNPAFLQLLGYGREEIVGSDGWTFSGGERSAFSREVHARVIAGESLHFEVRSRRKDGTPIDLDVRAVPIRHFGKPHTLGMARDITAQKRAQAALRESEERYQLAVAGANQGLWDWDLGADTMFVSARAQEFMGLEPSEPLRPRREWIALCAYHPDDVDAARAALSDHLHGKTSFFAVEYRLQHRSGNWHWYRQRGVALRDANGRPYRMAGSMEDITAQKDLEGQLLQAKKLEAIGTLAGGIAHDFNNILAAILGYGEMAQKSAAVGSALRRHVDAVVSAGMRAKSLVERILAFSRSGIGERKPVHVQAVVAETLDLVAASLPKHVRLVRALDAGEAAVLGDATQIHQVVMNLCANGAQAMKSEGTLAVSLDVVEKTRSMAATSALPAGRYVRLSVADTGSGIPAKILERIFDPFFTTKEVGVGTGLGLSLVHGIVTDLGGGIEVDSRPGEGAVFTVYLPWSSAQAASVPVDETVPEGAGETVLIVDDEEMLVRLGEEMIAGLGYEPVGFASSAAALESFRASPGRFHAVLTDESMPELTGSELAKEIRKLRPEIPIVMMSGVLTPALSVRARELGGVELLAKPVAERDLARILASALHANGRGS